MEHGPTSAPHPANTLSRRGFLAVSGALAAAGVVGFPAVALGEKARPTVASNGRARNLILLVADGMSLGTLSLGNLFTELRDKRSSHWLEWMNSPGVRTALIGTRSANAFVTDSAASASAWAIGERVDNRAISYTPDGRTPTPLFIRARTTGRAIGLVTNTAIWDATTAAFVANAPRREMHAPIAQQICEAQPDLMLGGGSAEFTDELLKLHANPTVIRSRDDLWAAHPANRPLVGLFANETFNFALDRTPTEPSVPEMLALALDRLSRHADGFVLVVEESLVDHAAHMNDAASLVRHQAELEEALRVATAFTSARDDTLLIATTDHANANPGLTIYNEEGERMFSTLLEFRHSIAWIMRQIRAIPRPERSVENVAPILETASNFQLSDEDRAVLTRALAREQVDPFRVRNNDFASIIGSIFANHCGVAFVSPNHTSDHVIASAMGPGSELLQPVMHNTALHTIMVEALGLPQTV